MHMGMTPGAKMLIPTVQTSGMFFCFRLLWGSVPKALRIVAYPIFSWCQFVAVLLFLSPQPLLFLCHCVVTTKIIKY